MVGRLQGSIVSKTPEKTSFGMLGGCHGSVGTSGCRTNQRCEAERRVYQWVVEGRCKKNKTYGETTVVRSKLQESLGKINVGRKGLDMTVSYGMRKLLPLVELRVQRIIRRSGWDIRS